MNSAKAPRWPARACDASSCSSSQVSLCSAAAALLQPLEFTQCTLIEVRHDAQRDARSDSRHDARRDARPSVGAFWSDASACADANTTL